MILGDRLRQARNIKGLTQTELAKAIGVAQPTVAQLELGQRQPAPETLDAIVAATGFPAAFFKKERRAHFPLGTLLFRGKARMLQSERVEAHELASLAYEAYESLARSVKPLPVKIPMLSDTSAVQAAQLTRSAIGLSPQGPIPDLLHWLEMAGLAILALPKALPNRDAFSAWTTTDVPVVVLSSDRPGDRQRWSASHELGHLVLHRQIRDRTVNLEREADAFASAFLMPEESIRRDMGRPVTLTSLAQLKPKWGVSIAALCMRARSLGLIDDGQLRYLYVQISKYGWRTREPELLDVPVERPRALRKMAELLYGIPIDQRRLATNLSLPPAFTQSLIEAHADRSGWSRAIPTPPSSGKKGKILGFKS